MSTRRGLVATVIVGFVIGLLTTAGPVAAQGAACSQCGAGPHWIDVGVPPAPPGGCPGPGGGIDQIANSGAVVGIDTDLDCVVDQSIIMSPCAAPNDLLSVQKAPGPLDDSVFFPGLRAVDGHRDVIDTEIIGMCLTGGGLTLVAGAGQQQGAPTIPLAPSRGAVAEQPGNPAFADSFFDVWFEVDLGGGVFVYNQGPLQVQSTVTCLPPAATYAHPIGCVPLFTDTIGGVHVANLVTAQHIVNPLITVPGTTSAGRVVLAVLLALTMAMAGWIVRRRLHWVRSSGR